MPSRFLSLAILVYWSVAAFCLLTWDVIPELSLGYPPDLRAIAVAGDMSRPVRWNVQVVDDARFPDVRRTVGEAVTVSSRRDGGGFELKSQVSLDAGGLLKATPFLNRSNLRLAIDSVYLVDKSGNLVSFEIDVKSHESPETLVQVKGKVKAKKLEVVTHGPIEMLNKKPFEIDYVPRGVVQDFLGPLDRLPGLKVGQRWDSQMINPFTGQISSVRVEVARRGLINWNGDSVPGFEVVQHMSPLTMRTWVDRDGVILRQEVPMPFVRLVLERRPEADDLRPSSLPQTRKPGS